MLYLDRDKVNPYPPFSGTPGNYYGDGDESPLQNGKPSYYFMYRLAFFVYN